MISEAGVFDVAIVGGGINGCGIARDAAGRGLRVHLSEARDLGGATSSASTKLIHGGLRYLETFQFRLVREALAEREVLLRLAPHLVRPMRFVLPHHRSLRSWPLLRFGLFLYDRLGGKTTLPASRALDLARTPEGAALKPSFRRALEYVDCWVDDSRLVVLNAVDARARGATIAPRTEVVAAEQGDGLWRLTLQDRSGRRDIAARALVNAAGPWVAVMAGRIAGSGEPRVRLVRGSHIVTRRLFAGDRAFIFQHRDRRVVFAIPYEQDFTLIGTTDCDHDGDPAGAIASPEEVRYLCDAVSAYFATPVQPADVVWSFAGVRPLRDGGGDAAQRASRDYALELDVGEGRPPLLTVIGGKLTTYRKLAEAALGRLAGPLGVTAPAWTGSVALPGGDFGGRAEATLVEDLTRACPFFASATAQRLVRLYGVRAPAIFAGAASIEDLGEDFGAGLTEREARHLFDAEWARTAEDVLWRRTKLGLRFDARQTARLAAFMNTLSEDGAA
ncbi:glycerol-3-phosphate dehydrogenase [Methylopila sp. Yamaguchi]|uniref:glycerol-3-phosphate dehydrogenase n=1 Tax=Methylopila sp. Yamaguchi TaxID=1437817 RepID=UPI000CBACF94|nr:glycerol-3-phosphate dehydrogenase [Methylopila sp. Yamaguchi]GBD47869.1 glycerol-3-phosphate dehydrogenase [Methylopila sp. Yamaguchi]